MIFSILDIKIFKKLLLKEKLKIEKRLKKIEQEKSMINNGCKERALIRELENTLAKINELPFFKESL